MILDMVDDVDNYVQSMLPLQWRLVGRQVRSLQGVDPAGHEELVRHRLQKEYWTLDIMAKNNNGREKIMFWANIHPLTPLLKLKFFF